MNAALHAEVQQNAQNSFVSQNAATEVEKIRKQLEEAIRKEEHVQRVHEKEKVQMESNYVALHNEYETANDHVYHETISARAKRQLFPDVNSYHREYDLPLSEDYEDLGEPSTAAAAASDAPGKTNDNKALSLIHI